MMKRLILGPALPLLLAALPMTMAAGVAAPARAAETAAAALTFEVGEPKGAVMVALYASPETWEGGAPVKAERLPVAGGSVRVKFTGLKPGRYAVKAFHDVDGDGAMNRNAFGMPTEPFGFSNNAPARFGPAVWSAAAFEVGPAGAAQTIVLR